MSYWNYRIIRRMRDEVITFGVHEVYYSDDSEIEFWTEEPVLPSGESAGELREDVFHFMSAFKYPVLHAGLVEGKEKLSVDNESCTVNRNHFFEVMDRASVVMGHFDEFVASHPAVRADERLREAAQRTVDALYAFYSEAAGVCLGEGGDDNGHREYY